MLRYRKIDIIKDKHVLLEFHCLINYESETSYARMDSYEEYRKKWLTTSQPETYLSDFAKSIEDKRTIVEILEDNSIAVGYLWVTFVNVHDYEMTVAEIRDIVVAPDYRCRGIGLMMLDHIEKLAKERGTTLLRSETGIENAASQKLHEKFGFKPYRIHYEKALQ